MKTTKTRIANSNKECLSSERREELLGTLKARFEAKVDSSRQEVQSFSKTTEIHKLASELEDKLPEK